MVIRDIVPRDRFQECLRVVVVLLNCGRLGLSYVMPLSAELDYQSHSAKVGQKTLKRFIESIREFRILTLALQIDVRLCDRRRVYEDGVPFPP